MGLHRQYWGQSFEEVSDCGKKIWKTIIDRPHIRKGEEPHFGLNEKLLHEAVKAQAIIQVDIQGRDPIRIAPLEIIAYSTTTGKIHREPSIVKPGTFFNIYLYPLPKEEVMPSF